VSTKRTKGCKINLDGTPELNGFFNKAILSLCKSSVARSLVINARDLDFFSSHICAQPPRPLYSLPAVVLARSQPLRKLGLRVRI